MTRDMRDDKSQKFFKTPTGKTEEGGLRLIGKDEKIKINKDRETIDRVVLMWQEGFLIRCIGKKLTLSPKTVKKILRLHGLY